MKCFYSFPSISKEISFLKVNVSCQNNPPIVLLIFSIFGVMKMKMFLKEICKTNIKNSTFDSNVYMSQFKSRCSISSVRIIYFMACKISIIIHYFGKWLLYEDFQHKRCKRKCNFLLRILFCHIIIELFALFNEICFQNLKFFLILLSCSLNMQIKHRWTII